MLPAGQLDYGFGAYGKSVLPTTPGQEFVNAAAVDGSGRTVIVGRTVEAASYTNFGITRLTSSGTLDTTFSGRRR